MLYLVEDWNDITIAFPVNILEIDKINELVKRITLNLLVENIEASSFLAENLTSKYLALAFYEVINVTRIDF